MVDEEKLFLDGYENLTGLINSVSSSGMILGACPTDAEDCTKDTCSGGDVCTDCSSDCSSDCRTDCRSDCGSDCSDCSDTPAYRVYVTTYLDNVEYDSGSGNYTVQTQTVSTWKASIGVATPPNSDFFNGSYTLGGSAGTCTLSTSLRNTAILRISLKYKTKEPEPITSVTFKTYLDGTQYDSKSGNFANQSHTYDFWYSSFITNYHLQVPSGTLTSIKNGTTPVSLNDTLSVTGSPSSVTVNVYYQTGQPVVVNSITLDPKTCYPEESIKLYFTYSGQKDSSGSWQVYQTTTPTYTNPVRIVADYYQGASYIPFTAPATAGTYYIWLRYYGSVQGWSDPTINKPLTVNATPSSSAYIYSGGIWHTATPYIYTSGSWHKAESGIYSGGWHVG